MGQDGPFTLQMAVPIVGHTERTRAMVRRMVANGELVVAGQVQLREVYGPKSPKSNVYVHRTLKVKRDWLQHDTMLHYWKRLLPDARIALGYDCDPDFLADGEGRFSNGYEAVIEMDRETESLSDVLRRLAVHRGHDKDILFITLTEGRVEKIGLRLDDDLAGRIWFAVWYDLVKAPNEWADVDGVRQALYPLKG